jgi:CHAT domain-containing protein
VSLIPVIRFQRCKDDEVRPRLWWCPTGPLAELPLHAAGVYNGPDQDCIFNYVVSSYTPTLSALINAQAKTRGLESGKTLVIAQSVVEGLSPLPNTSLEAEIIRRTVPPENLIVMKEEQVTRQKVLDELPGTTVLHLACHGHQDAEDPLMCGFSLRDGRLTLAELLEVHTSSAQLAYLSVCETAGTDENQPDEALNLAATMLFVGFKSVIATMWCVVRKIFEI